LASPFSEGPTILVAEDEPEVREFIQTGLRCRGYRVDGAANGDQVLSYLREGKPADAVVLDIIMPGKGGLDTLREIRKFNRELPIIILSGASSIVNVVEAMRIGATDFIAKPVIADDLRRAIKTALETNATRTAAANQPESRSTDVEYFISNSPRYRQLRSTLKQIGSADVPVLILGETGVGKEVLARQIHRLSKRANKVFLKLNCAALPAELVESELFGYERGAFTGAFQRKPGMFELADGGTLMLDEIGDMDLKLQSKLLQVLQDQEFHRVGGRETVRVDVRVLAATHRDLESDVQNGRFRADLYYRLNVVSVRLPALRERAEDIVPLAEFLLSRHTGSDNDPPAMTHSLKEAMFEYQWPGNIRELENVVRRFTVLRDPLFIEQELREKIARRAISAAPQMAGDSGGALSPGSLPVLERVTLARKQAETDAILSALAATRWNRKRAASMLNIDYKALLYKMKKLGIDDDSDE
jgi:two-component system response regulator AtoC